jgi:hypothetical protein
MKLLVLGFLLSATALAQDTIPPGTVLAAQLNSSIGSRKGMPGKTVSARLMQDVPLSRGKRIHAGAKIVGRVVRVQAATNGHPAELTIQFDKLNASHASLPVVTNLRALASMMEVGDAQVPPSGPDRGTPSAWTTRNLIGGEVAYGEDAPVARGNDIVGRALAEGVLVPVAANRESGCRGEVAGNDRPQALWVFSSDACGLYGYPDVRIAHSGRTDPVGRFTLTSPADFVIQSGSGILLRVGGAATE